ncbi:MAG: TonB family protein, partial [Myxococcota bacterium]
TEIRGLGADSFLSKRVGPSSGDGIPNTLEVALLWGETVLAVERFDRPQTVQVGEAQGCRFTLPREALGAGSYPLIQAVDDAFVLNWANPLLTGDLLVDGKVQGLDDLRAEGVGTLTFAEPARARLKAGAFTLLVTFGPAPKRVVAPALGDVDVDPWISVAVSAIVHVAFLVSLSFMPLDLGQLTERDPRQALDRTVEALMIQPDAALAEAKAPEVDRAPSPLARRDANTADLNVANPEVEGDAVRPTLSDALARPRPDAPTHDSVSASHQRSRAKQLVQETALNQAMAQNNPLLTEVLNTVPDTTHRPTFKALAGSDANRGPSLASSLDVFGGSTFAPNGGPLQTVGGPTSPAGQPGSGPVIAGLPRGPRNGGDGPGFVAPEERKPAVIGGKLATTGGLDRRTVELHIRRNIGGIKWCYQERLQLKRGLTGKVTVAFTILPNGRVANARTTNSSLSDAVLEGCIRTKVSRWKFPAVKDGGVAEVEYPLVLRTP